MGLYRTMQHHLPTQAKGLKIIFSRENDENLFFFTLLGPYFTIFEPNILDKEVYKTELDFYTFKPFNRLTLLVRLHKWLCR